MKVQTKQWFLYGTLFAALGFSVSGNDNKLAGYAHFSSQQLAGKASPEADAQLAAAAEARKAARNTSATAAPTDAGKPKPQAVQQPQEQTTSSTTATVTPSSAPVQTSDAAKMTAPAVATASAPAAQSRGNGESSNGGRVATQTAPTGTPTFEDYVASVDGHDYKVSIRMANGETHVIYSEKSEGSDCKDECGKEPRVAVIGGDAAQNLSALRTKIREELIPKDIKRKKDAKAGATASDDSDDKEETSKGYITLKAKIHQRCKHLSEGRAETECKAKKFVELLKADKKVAKTKDKKGNKKERLIKDEDAEQYFKEEIYDGLKEMLVHKFDIRETQGLSLLEQRLDLQDISSDLLNEKREARENRNLAKDLIKDLLRDIDGEYSSTRRTISSLYKESIKEQASEALSNLSARNDYARANDFPKAQAAFASFLENFGLSRTLNTELYSTMSDSLSFAKRNGLLESDSYRDILGGIDSYRASILKDFINNPRILEMGITSLDGALAGVTNSSRGMRGNVTSGSVGGSNVNALVRQVLSNGGTRTGVRGN